MKTPEDYTEEHQNFLNDLRDSEAINMTAAIRPLMLEFGLTHSVAKAYLFYWTHSYD